MSRQGATIGEQLGRALAMTELLLLSRPTQEQVERVIAERAPLLASAVAMRDAGEPWGEAEAALAARILAVDARLLAELWTSHKDSFAWLQQRDPCLSASMPELAALAAQQPGATVSDRSTAVTEANSSVAGGLRAAAAWRYAKMGALR
jgi:hypothetical protein